MSGSICRSPAECSTSGAVELARMVGDGARTCGMGAVVATVLAIRELVSWRRDRSVLAVTATLARSASDMDDAERDPRALLVVGAHGLDEAILLQVGISNSGHGSIQITGVYFETARQLTQVIAEGLPLVLEPGSRVEAMVQVEWIAFHSDDGLLTFGAMAAAGNLHRVTPVVQTAIVQSVRELKTRVALSKRRPDADKRLDETVCSFQTFDRAVVTNRERGTTYNFAVGDFVAKGMAYYLQRSSGRWRWSRRRRVVRLRLGSSDP